MAQNKNIPKRGALWTDDEENQLLEELFSEKLSVKQIAQTHNRTVKAIEHRLAKIAAVETTHGSSVADTASKYHVTESLVENKCRQLQTEKKPKMTDRVAQLEARVAQLEAFIQQMQPNTENQQLPQMSQVGLQ
jgi:transposase-like protein